MHFVCKKVLTTTYFNCGRLLPLFLACVINGANFTHPISGIGFGGCHVLSDWQFIAIFVVLAPIFPAAPVLANALLAPRKPNYIKQQIYECGVETVGDTWVQFKVQYYIYALIFVIFDIEAVFLFPIAAAYGQVALFAVVEIVLFIAILTAALAYAWGRGVLEWV